ncbi:MAG TPA: Gfo/Idh/MocA family oxidoreductase [Dehalococcoidia bacterium]
MAQVRVGIIGAGFIGRFHARGIRGLIKAGLVDARYVAVCDVVEERAREFGRIAGLPLVTTDPERLIRSDEVDAVYVCTPTAQHKALVLAAAAEGKAVFCEKPLATTLADVEEMTAAVTGAGVPHQVGLVLRHSPVYTVLWDLIQDPRLGRPVTAVFRDDQFFPIQGRYASTWRCDYATAGGGTLIEHSIHDLDLLRWLLGEAVAIRAETRNYAGFEGVEDLATVRLEFASGCTAYLASVWHNVLSRESSRRLELFFENGYFWVDRDFVTEIHYETSATGGMVTLSADQVVDRYLDLIGCTEQGQREAHRAALLRYSLEDCFFLRAVAAGEAPAPGFEVALAAHRLVDAAYRSAREGREVVLE